MLNTRRPVADLSVLGDKPSIYYFRGKNNERNIPATVTSVSSTCTRSLHIKLAKKAPEPLGDSGALTIYLINVYG